jgi:hypothetical protein
MGTPPVPTPNTEDNGSSWRYNIGIGILCLLAFVGLFSVLTYKMFTTDDVTIKLPLLVIVGVMALFATLALVSVTFSLADLDDKTQPLGLPEGSVRAAIALSLIVIFAIVAIYFYTSMLVQPCSNCKADKTSAPLQKSTSYVTRAVLAAEQPPKGADQAPQSPAQSNPPKTSEAAPAATPAPATLNDNNRTAANDFAKQVFAVVGTLMTSVASFYFASRATATGSPAPTQASTPIPKP